jgi:hypothetical protein
MTLGVWLREMDGPIEAVPGQVSGVKFMDRTRSATLRLRCRWEVTVVAKMSETSSITMWEQGPGPGSGCCPGGQPTGAALAALWGKVGAGAGGSCRERILVAR